jgi:putative SOS response-associated peptidase YedK
LPFKAHTLNARSETVFNLPSFRSVIGKKRCLVIVDGFYEWHTIGKNKYPHFIYLKDKKAFAMGGIYDEWADPDTGEIITTCSILTVPGNPLMSRIHNKMDDMGNPDPRMPLILNLKDERAWIDQSLPKNEIESLMKPFDENQMSAHTISKLITSRKEDSNVPAVKVEFVYPELEKI